MMSWCISRFAHATALAFILISSYFFDWEQTVDLGARIHRSLYEGEPTTADGSFQGVPIIYMEGLPPDSTVHCTGDTFGTEQELDWLYRSCEFRNICFDLSKKEFILFPSKQEQLLASLLAKRKDTLVTVSSISMNSDKRVALGAVEPPNPQSLRDDLARIRQFKQELAWFPTVVTEKSRGFYQLPDSHVFVPFRETSPVTSESLMQKDFLSIYALISTFGLEDKKLVLLRHATTQDPCHSTCADLIRTNLPSMGVDPHGFSVESTQVGTTPWITLRGKQQTSLVCSKYAAAGLGMLMTGSSPVRDENGFWIYTHIIGRESTERAFQEFVTRNKGTQDA